MNRDFYKTIIDAFMESGVVKEMMEEMIKPHWMDKKSAPISQAKSTRYRSVKGFGDLIRKKHKSGILRIRKSKVHKELNLPPISRQAGWVNVEEELRLIAERRLHGHSVD